MGLSCCKPSASDVMTPDAETRRRQQVEAAEKRRATEATRGVKDLSQDKAARLQQRQEEMEKREAELARQGGPTLKWTSG